nr:reverse transcriptase domain-containing protein [Tanacetum cinerariifolium]
MKELSKRGMNFEQLSLADSFPQLRNCLGVEVDCFFDRRELFCFVDEVFDSEYVQVQKQLNLGVGTKRMIFNINSAIKYSYSNVDTCLSIDVIDEIVEEDCDALLDEGSKILYSIEETILEDEFFFEFDKFIAMDSNEKYDSESDEVEPKFKKITINTNYKIKTSLKEPPTNLELKPFPNNLEYVFLEEPSFLPVIISS